MLSLQVILCKTNKKLALNTSVNYKSVNSELYFANMYSKAQYGKQKINCLIIQFHLIYFCSCVKCLDPVTLYTFCILTLSLYNSYLSIKCIQGDLLFFFFPGEEKQFLYLQVCFISRIDQLIWKWESCTLQSSVSLKASFSLHAVTLIPPTYLKNDSMW